MKMVLDVITIIVAGNNVFLAGIAADRRDWKWATIFLAVGGFLFWVATL